MQTSVRRPLFCLPHGVEEELRKGIRSIQYSEDFLRETRREAGVVSSKDTPFTESVLWKGPEVGKKRVVSLEPEQFWGGIGGRQKVRTAELKAAVSG